MMFPLLYFLLVFTTLPTHGSFISILYGTGIPYQNLFWEDRNTNVWWRQRCNFPGHDLRQIYDTSSSLCGAHCRDEPQCLLFKFKNDLRVCYLKTASQGQVVRMVNLDNGICGLMADRVGSTGGPPLNPSPGASSISVIDGNGEPVERLNWEGKYAEDIWWMRSCDFPGHDIRQYETTSELCGPECRIDPQCILFKFREGTCWHKRPGQGQIVRMTQDSGVCGNCGLIAIRLESSIWVKGFSIGVPVTSNVNLYIQGWEDMNTNIWWRFDCDFPGHTYNTFWDTTSAMCGPHCRDDPQCIFFKFSGGTCWLKRPGIRETAWYTDVSDGICGLISDRLEMTTVVNSEIWWTSNCLFPRFNIKKFFNIASIQECGQRCLDILNCSFFSYSTSTKICSLKSPFPVNTWPTVEARAGYICGFITTRTTARPTYNWIYVPLNED